MVNDEPNSEDISKQMDKHYSIEERNRRKDRYKYIYILCNDLKNNLNFNFKKQNRSTSKCSPSKCSTSKCSPSKCSTSKCSTSKCSTSKCSTSKCSTSKCSTSKCSTSDSGSINFREVNRGCNIESFYIKEELLEMLIYSICYDDMEKKNCHLFVFQTIKKLL